MKFKINYLPLTEDEEDYLYALCRIILNKKYYSIDEVCRKNGWLT